MWGAENLRKSAKYSEEDKQKYIEAYRTGIYSTNTVDLESLLENRLNLAIAFQKWKHHFRNRI
jgi:hypothetical protein